MQIRMNHSHQRDEFCAAAVQGAEVQAAGVGVLGLCTAVVVLGLGRME